MNSTLLRKTKEPLEPRANAPPADVSLPVQALQLWHLLSLDAPTVATLWTVFVAHCARVVLPPAVVPAMFLAVWILYAVDRLLDGRRAFPPEDLEERHLFHHRHRRLFLGGILVATPLLIALLTRLPPALLAVYGALAAALAAWLLVIHLVSRGLRLPKEFAVGFFFSAAIFVPEFATPAARWAVLPAALLFAALCTLNCLFIHAWEHAFGETAAAHASTRWAVQYLRLLAAALIAAAVALACAQHDPLFAISLGCTASTAGLLLLDGQAAGRTTRRAAADLFLLTPLLLLPFC